uniref:Uncharacterized protein n=1 Tax=Arundo donax TaxID=35708 RepID=A0A0A8Z2V7_ARUDO
MLADGGHQKRVHKLVLPNFVQSGKNKV